MIDHTRHMGIFNVDNVSATIIGAGGIGAITAITLAKMGVGFNNGLHIFDDDTVDDVNIATQFYRVSDVGSKKVNVLKEIIDDYSGLYAYDWFLRVDDMYPLPDTSLYISTVDSIDSRKGIWESVVAKVSNMKPNQAKQTWYLDARMGAEVFEMFIVNLWEPLWYEAHIVNANDSDIPDVPCTEKATIYTANIAAGHIGAAVRRIKTMNQSPGFLRHDIFNNEISFLEMK